MILRYGKASLFDARFALPPQALRARRVVARPAIMLGKTAVITHDFEIKAV
jgi:hypothetical protein